MKGESKSGENKSINNLVKRIIDVLVSGSVILVALPLWIIVTFAIKLDSPGLVFFRGVRTGKGGETFRIYKFRTMVQNAEKKGPGITTGQDLRITTVGKFLRKFKIDEMPQLINVVKGEMSIVGPRPEDPRYVTNYSERQKKVLSVRPGMASPAFIRYRHEEAILEKAGEAWEEVYVQKVLPEKLEMDLDYIQKQSIWYDFGIFFQAALSLFGDSPE